MRDSDKNRTDSVRKELRFSPDEWAMIKSQIGNRPFKRAIIDALNEQYKLAIKQRKERQLNKNVTNS